MERQVSLRLISVLFVSILSLPLAKILYSFVEAPFIGEETLRHAFHSSGLWSGCFAILALMITPLNRIAKGDYGFRFFTKKGRRYFGVLSFIYGLVHTLIYLYETGTLERIIDDLFEIIILSGWIIFIIYIPLAITSHDYFTRKLGYNWKRIHKANYFAFVALAVHWVLTDEGNGYVNFLTLSIPLLFLIPFRLIHDRNVRAQAQKRRTSQ